MASRLAEDSRFSVLVIEAGPDEQNNTIINDPAQATPATMTFSWQYQTTPQTVGGNVLTIFQSVPYPSPINSDSVGIRSINSRCSKQREAFRRQFFCERHAMDACDAGSI